MAKSTAIEYTFKDGGKIGPGKKRATPVKTKESLSTNGLTKYVTILWSDKVLTCNCQGWAMRKYGTKPDGSKNPLPRTCKHCKASKDCNYTDMAPIEGVTQLPMPSSGRQLRKVTIRE